MTAAAVGGRRARQMSTRGTTRSSRGSTSRRDGWIHGAWQDRRLDTTSPVGVGEWPTSKTRQGNYLHWFWGGRCRTTTTGPITHGRGSSVRPSERADHHAADGTGRSAGHLRRSNADHVPVPELRDLRHSVQPGLLLPGRHLLRRLRERADRQRRQRLGDVDRCPERSLVSDADRPEPGLRAVRRVGRPLLAAPGRARAADQPARPTRCSTSRLAPSMKAVTATTMTT